MMPDAAVYPSINITWRALFSIPQETLSGNEMAIELLR
jgi:hypothetical protein